ncbi:MAG: hypothetical protein KGI56_04245 [Acidobacteriota bacterium]|nr:hypothetical protein [Acidobacteriota bacterium]
MNGQRLQEQGARHEIGFEGHPIGADLHPDADRNGGIGRLSALKPMGDPNLMNQDNLVIKVGARAQSPCDVMAGTMGHPIAACLDGEIGVEHLKGSVHGRQGVDLAGIEVV